MPDAHTPPEEDITHLRARIEELEAELARRRLRSRVENLEAELAQEERQLGTPRRNTSDTVVDASNGLMDDIGRLVRGLTLANLENLRLSADAVSVGVEETHRRNRGEAGRSVKDLVRNLPGDVYAGIVKTVEQSRDIPKKVMETFTSVYREGEISERFDRKMRSETTGSGR